LASSEGTDFTSLAKLLTHYDSADAGTRPLDVGPAASEIGLQGPGAGGKPWLLNLEGVLVGTNVVTGQWDTSVPEDTFNGALAAKLDGRPGELPPPTYGSSQAEFRGPRPLVGNQPRPLSGFDTTTQQWFHGSLANHDGATWLRALNLDPRYRVMAALGTEVVQRYQNALMASAWEQAGELRKVNQVLARGQLARETSGFIYRNRIGASSSSAPLADDRFMQITTAVHSQVAAPAGTVTSGSIATAVAQNPSLQSALSTPFRRITRSGGPLAKSISATPLPPPVVPIALGAAQVTPPLRPVTGQVPIERLSADKVSLSNIDAVRVQTHVFPWEPPPLSTSAGPATPRDVAVSTAAAVPAIPYGFMADLLVTTQSPGTDTLVLIPPGSSFGRALDIDGVPQLGWNPPPDDVLGSVISNSIPHHAIAFTCVDLAGFNGFITFLTNISGGGSGPGDPLAWQITGGWACSYSGYLLDAFPSQLNLQSLGPGTSETDYYLGPYVDSLAVAATDITGKGQIDVVFVWMTGSWSQSSDYGFQQHTTYLKVGFGFDPTLPGSPLPGGISGPWTNAQLIGDSLGPLSVTAIGSQVCILSGKELRVVSLDQNTGEIVGPAVVSDAFGTQLPPDFISGAIASAAFGVSGMDLVFCFSAGQPGQLRVAYRLLYDVKSDGSIGGLGDIMSLPFPGGDQMQLHLAVMTAASAALRTEQTQKFRIAAATTQARQQWLLTLAVPPPPPPEVPIAPLAQQLRSAIDPNITVPKSVLGRFQLPSPIDTTTPLSDVLQPAQSGPYFPQAMYETFRDLHPDRFIPGGWSMPDNRVTLVKANRKAVEAFLLGLNAHMARSLLWHGFPGGLQATYFDRFWDVAYGSDITPINGWMLDSDLGSHAPGYTGNTHSNTAVDGLSANVLLAGWQPGMKIADADGDIPQGTTIAAIAADGRSLTLSAPATGSHASDNLIVAGGNPLVLLARGELLRRVPHATVFAAPVQGNGTRTLDLSRRLDPIFTGRLNPDIAFFGFNLTAEEASGDGSTLGWYIVFQEPPTAPRFGPTRSTNAFGSKPAHWRDLDWSQLVANETDYDTLTYINCSKSPLAGVALADNGTGGQHRFGFSAAHMAHIMFRPAVQVAIHASIILQGSS